MATDRKDFFSEEALKSQQGKLEAAQEIYRLAFLGRTRETGAAALRVQLRTLSQHPLLGAVVETASRLSHFSLELPKLTPTKRERTELTVGELGSGAKDPNLQPEKTISESKRQKTEGEEIRKSQLRRLLKGRVSKSGQEKLKAKKKELEKEGKVKEEIEEALTALEAELVEAEKLAIRFSKEEAEEEVGEQI